MTELMYYVIKVVCEVVRSVFTSGCAEAARAKAKARARQNNWRNILTMLGRARGNLVSPGRAGSLYTGSAYLPPRVADIQIYRQTNYR